MGYIPEGVWNGSTWDNTIFMVLTIFIPNCFPIGNNKLDCHQLGYVFINIIDTKLYSQRCTGGWVSDSKMILFET